MNWFRSAALDQDAETPRSNLTADVNSGWAGNVFSTGATRATAPGLWIGPGNALSSGGAVHVHAMSAVHRQRHANYVKPLQRSGLDFEQNGTRDWMAAAFNGKNAHG